MSGWGSLGEVTWEVGHIGGAGNLQGKKEGMRPQEKPPDLKGLAVDRSGGEAPVEGGRFVLWLRPRIQLGAGSGAGGRGGESGAAACEVIMSPDSGASVAGFTSQPCREIS